MFRNVWNGKYLGVDCNKLAERSFGCKVSLQGVVDERSRFRIGQTDS